MTIPQYDSLSDAAITRMAMEALRRYPQTAQGALRLFCRSENATFRIDAGGNRYALRVHRENYHTRQSIGCELQWLDALRADTGLVVPEALPDADGERVQTLRLENGSQRFAVLFQWVDGEAPTADAAPKTLRQLGEITALLHRHSRQWTKPEGFQRITWNHDTMVGRRSHWGDWRNVPGLRHEDHAVIEEAIARIGKKLAAYGQSPRRYGLIHADLRLANLLLHASGPRIIDFDDCGMGWFIHDLASAISFEEHSPLAGQWVENWLQGYERAGHLDKEDLAMLPGMIMQRRIQMTAWVATHAATATARSLGPQWVGHTVRLCRRYLEGNMPTGV